MNLSVYFSKISTFWYLSVNIWKILIFWNIWGRHFVIIINRFDGFLGHRIILPLTMGVAAGSSFHLWPVKYAPKIIVEGVLQLL